MPATVSHYQMSDMFKMAGVSFWHRSMRNKIQKSPRCCAWSGSRCTHSFFSTTQQAGRGGCWGQQVSVSETIHCALWGLDWGYPLNNCSGCWNWFKVFRRIFFLPSISQLRRLQAANNCIYWPQDHFSCLVKNADPQASLYLGEFSHVMSQLNICCIVCVFFWVEATVIS